MLTEEKNLEDVILDLKLIPEVKWNEAVKESQTRQVSLEKIILDKKLLSSEVLTKAKAIALKVPYVDLKKVQIPEELHNIIPEHVAQKYQMLVFFKNDEILKVAMVDPTDFRAIDYLRSRTNCKVEPHISAPEDINNLLGVYRQFDRSIGAVLEAVQDNDSMEDIFRLTKEISLSSDPSKIQPDSTPVVHLVNNFLDYTIKNKSSDLHIEPLEKETRTRCRIDGILHDIAHFPINVHAAIISRIKIMANLKIDEKRIPQDGRITLKAHDRDYDLRVSTLPTIFGEKIVIRILTKTEKILTLEELGLRGRGKKLAEEYFKRTNGMFLSTGPTSSGKSTTLYSALTYVSTPQVNTITLEDPVEHVIEGINQVQINVPAGLTFGSGLRSIVRQDPNIIMVGEIRDSETAGLAVNAALTGHLVFSTLHTNSAASSITRLIDIGVEPFLVSSTLNIVIAQRLVRTICADCKEPIKVTPAIWNMVKKHLPFLFQDNVQKEEVLKAYPIISENINEDTLQIYRGRGCNMCLNSGFRGRIGIFEVLELTDYIKDLVVKKSSDRELEKAAIKEGMITLIQEGILKVLDGYTTIEEVLRVAA